MKRILVFIAAWAAAGLMGVALAPSTWAMVLPADPGAGGGGAGGPVVPPVQSGATSPWVVVGIVLVAVVIGAVGSYFAQRTHRQERSRSMSIA